MKWVTWENVGVDRMGCAWLIRKHVDPEAEFVFVKKGEAIPEGAEPFDIPGVKLSHHGGHCSFHAVLKQYEIEDATLRRVCRIIDEADTVQEVNVETAAAGLDLICEGIRLVSESDQIALERGTFIYDALYAKLQKEELL